MKLLNNSESGEKSHLGPKRSKSLPISRPTKRGWKGRCDGPISWRMQKKGKMVERFFLGTQMDLHQSQSQSQSHLQPILLLSGPPSWYFLFFFALYFYFFNKILRKATIVEFAVERRLYCSSLHTTPQEHWAMETWSSFAIAAP